MTSTSESKRLAMTVAYDGKNFQGWQVQPDSRTVQDEIEKAFEVICGGERPRIHGSGRTDTGVHARGQVFHVDPARVLTKEKWVEALNGVMPFDIRIMNAQEVSFDFHARFNAVCKEYRYFIYQGQVMPPELRGVRHHVRKPLDLEAMQKATDLLRGQHDFLSFSANRGKPEESTVRNLMDLRVEKATPECCVVAKADGFMYKMVRQLAGALLRVGLGELSLSELKTLLTHPERNHVAPTAPAQALFLWNVTYPDESL